MGKGNLLGTIIVSNDRNIDIFRIHVFDDSIRFDDRIAYGISKNENVFYEISKIIDKWKLKQITTNDIFHLIVDAIIDSEEDLSKYYFRKEELDIKGKYQCSYINKYDKMYVCYSCLKSGEKLNVITKKEFEDNIKNPEIAYNYIENYVKNGAKYYMYDIGFEFNDRYKSIPNKCYFMLYKDKVKIGFFEKI